VELESLLLSSGLDAPWNSEPLCVDFDGVLHHYTSAWTSPVVIPDPPVPGALEWLDEVCEAFTVHVFSVRSTWPGAIQAMRDWFEFHGFDSDRLSFPVEKPYSRMYIDDRGYHFTGDNFPSVEEMKSFVPWNKR